jgi:EmrB/QacA subfamily drug resistance transporter
VFPVLALGTIMATLDISVVNIALPTLSRSFGVPLTTIEWVVLAYVLTITGLLLTLGRMADRYGRRRIYGIGLAVFTLASGLCAAAPSAHTLIAARTLQGLGAAMMTANSAALLIVSFPPEERGRALGAFGAMVGVGLAMGPPLGGALVQHLSWRWIFLINLPLGVLALALLPARVPTDPPRASVPRLHLPAAALWSAALTLFMLALSRGPSRGWGVAGVGPLFAIAAALLAAFAFAERRASDPLLPLADLNGPLGIAVTLTLLGNLVSIAVGFHLPLYLEEVLGFDAGRSGRWMVVLPLMALVLAPIAGRWSDRWGARRLSVLGFMVTAVGLTVLAGVGVQPHPVRILGGMTLVGIGQGLFAVPNSRALLSAVPRERLGLANGLQGTMRNLGISGGAALTAALMASRFAAHGGGPLAAGTLAAADRVHFTRATAETYLVMAAIAVLGALLATRSATAGHRAHGPGESSGGAKPGRCRKRPQPLARVANR